MTTMPDKILGFLENNPRQPGYTIREIGAGIGEQLDGSRRAMPGTPNRLRVLSTTLGRMASENDGRLVHCTQKEWVSQRTRSGEMIKTEKLVARYSHPDWDLA